MGDLKEKVKKYEDDIKVKANLFKKNPIETRVAAAKGFGELKIPKGHPLSLEVIEQLRGAASKEETEIEVRKEAVTSIEKLGIIDKALSIFLSDLSTLDGHAEVRERAAHALGTYKMETPREVEKYQLKALRKAACKDANKLVRIAALDAMLEIKSVAATDKVVKELLHLATKESEGPVRERLVTLFGAFGEENASVIGDEMVNALIGYIGRDYFDEVRSNAITALSKFVVSGGRTEDILNNYAEAIHKSKVKKEREHLCFGLHKIITASPKALNSFSNEAKAKLKEAQKSEPDDQLAFVVAQLK